MKYILLLLFIFTLFLNLHAQNNIYGKVVKIADGDTFTILDNKNKQHKVRFYGIDCPEKGQDYFQVAKDFTSKHAKGKNVRIEVKSTDRYGRKVGVVWINSNNLNAKLLQEGLAWHYNQYDKSLSYANAEKTARLSKKNIWSHKKPVAPWEFRKSKGKKNMLML